MQNTSILTVYFTSSLSLNAFFCRVLPQIEVKLLLLAIPLQILREMYTFNLCFASLWFFDLQLCWLITNIA